MGLRGPQPTVDYEYVISLLREGWTYQVIAEAAGCTKERVRQIGNAHAPKVMKARKKRRRSRA